MEKFRLDEEPYGSRDPSKIMSVDDHKLTFRHKRFPTIAGEPAIETMHENIRSCPPQSHMEKRWIRGDIVEVFDLHSWRRGKIMKVLQDDCFVVRIIGAIQLKEFHVSNIRAQQALHHDQWVMTNKVSGKKQIDNHYPHLRSKHPTHLDNRADIIPCEGAFSEEKIGQDCDATLKNHDTVRGMSKKRRETMELDGSRQRTKRALTEKVNVVPSSRPMVGSHLPIKYRVAKLIEMDVENGNTKYHDMHSTSASLPIIEENNECSVASCSSNNLPKCSSRKAKKHSREISSSLFDGYPSIPGEKLATNLHELELHAYQSTLQALHASGPLSWEQESLLTNLRQSLHITNEEHLLHLRYLLSA